MRQPQFSQPSAPRLLATTLLGGLLVGCGGGGGSGGGSGGTDVPGLDIPQKVSLLDAKSSGGDDGAAGDGGTDYASDPAHRYVYDPSMEALDTVNRILCFIAQTGTTSQVNAGPYIALVDERRCEEKGGESDQGGGSSAPEYVQWVAEVTRANATAPQVAKFWVPGEDDGDNPMDGQAILAELTVHSAPTAAMPNGEFVLNFKGALDGASVGMAGTEVSLMRGTLKSVDNAGGGAQLSFFNEAGTHLPGLAALGVDFASLERVNVVSGGAGDNSGRAVTSVEQSDGGGSSENLYAVDFNAGGMQRGRDANGNGALEAGELTCLSRDDYDTYGWRYNLYHSGTGERVALNSGFPFNRVNGVDAMGYVGYWGVWTDSGEALQNGDQISRRSEDDSGAEQLYTVAVSAGKLRKRSRGTVAFSDLQGAVLEWHGDVADPYCDSGCANQESHLVSIDAAGTVTATHRWDESGGERELVALDPAVDVTPTGAGDTLNLWSEGLGGSVNYQHGSAALTAYQEAELLPHAAELSAGLSLVCYQQCPIGGVSSPAPGDALYHASGRRTYTLNSSAGVYQLVDDGNGEAVALSDTSGLGQGGEHTALQSGAMVALADDPGALNWWEIYNADTTYHWQSGAQPWSQNYVVVDAGGEVVGFDQPLQFFYNYRAGDDVNLDPALGDHPAGNAYRLSYGGEGNLWGFPYSAEDGCSGDRCQRYPDVTLADGVTLGSGDSYRVRLIEAEQRMREDAGACGGLDAAAVLADAALALPEAVDAEVSFALADKPDLGGATPAVIAGVLQ